MRFLFALMILILLMACTPVSNKFYWLTHCEDLEGGKYKACYGPGIKSGDKYEQIHWPSANIYVGYKVSVVQVVTDKSYTQLFSKEFSNSQVDSILLTEEPSKVVTYDTSSRTVFFDVGRSKAMYRIGAASGP